MSSNRKTQEAQADMRVHTDRRSDLPSQYRPIGIGAVAGALVAANRDTAGEAQDASNSNTRADSDSLAA